MINSEQAHQAQKLYKQTLLRLGEMLKILKQGDNSRNREILKNHCDYLSTQGKTKFVRLGGNHGNGKNSHLSTK